MRNTITYANRLYSLKETFDVNLTLDYENDSWSEWHIIREFISNALDSVNMDTSKVKIERLDNFFTIADMGTGFPIVMAKRIGASSKKNDSESIGQFGEGSKMAILTCMRKNINVLLGSQNWLIKPYVSEAEGQQVLHYNIYYCQESILGSFVLLEASEAIVDIIDNLDNYFLCYSQQELLFGVNKSGILRRTSEEYKGNIYNKEVFIKTVPALFSYGISLEKMNRDRDLIDLEDLKTVIRNILRNCKCKEVIKEIIKAALNTYIHELTHQISGADDYGAFAATLNEKLTELIMEYVEEHGFIKNLKLLDCLLELPDDLKISAKDLNVLVIAYGDQLVIKTANNQLTIQLDSEIEPKVYKRKIRFGKDTFSVLIPEDIAQYIITDKGSSVQCRIK